MHNCRYNASFEHVFQKRLDPVKMRTIVKGRFHKTAHPHHVLYNQHYFHFLSPNPELSSTILFNEKKVIEKQKRKYSRSRKQKFSSGTAVTQAVHVLSYSTLSGVKNFSQLLNSLES